MSAIKLVRSIPVANTLGEGVICNPDDCSIWWTDIQEKKLFRYDPENDELIDWALPERLSAFAFTSTADRLICAFASGFAFYTVKTGERQWIARPEADDTRVRFNDGKIDRQGRFWAGGIVEGYPSDHPGTNLYCLEGDLRCIKKESGIRNSNSLCWSPDSRYMYFADSPTHQIRIYDFDAPTAGLSNQRVFATIDTHINPDGSTVDAGGYLWNAQWGGGRIVRYTSAGAVDRIIETPCSQPTCVTFGGRDMRYLFVSSARDGLSREALLAQPEAGNLFIYETPFTGIADRQFVQS